MDAYGKVLIDDEYDELKSYKNDYEKAEYLQTILINHCINAGEASNQHYQYLRKYFLSKDDTKDKVPSWIRKSRDLNQFWMFIKYKIGSYAERRYFIWEEFNPFLEYLESIKSLPHIEVVDEKLRIFKSDYIMSDWKKALDRKNSDPEGAITIARTLLESVLKHILDKYQILYTKNLDLHELYKLVSDKLKLSPSDHHEKLFRQILGGCSSIISGLGNLRNDFGDAHGKGKAAYRPSERHAELAVNLSGSMCLFLLQTYEWNKQRGNC